MRVVIALMKHETNTFSPVPTPLERFGQGTGAPWYGQAAFDRFKGTKTGIGAFIDLAEQEGAEIVTPFAGEAWPSRFVEAAAFETIAERIGEAVAQGCDAVLLDLHGAMVVEGFDDGEGELLERLRRIAPSVPIATSLDMHANVTDRIVRHSTVVAGFQTYPHIDLYETGLRAGRPIFDLLKGRARPVMVWGQRPMLPHIMRQGTDDSPNRDLQQLCRRFEQEGALAASLFTGFPHADIRDAGLSAVVVTDHDVVKADTMCAQLLTQAWDARDDFVYHPEPLEDSVAKAKAITDGPVVMLDHYDNTGSGGTMDTTATLREILRQELQDVVFFAIYDPAAVAKLVDAGIGARVTLPIGGNFDMPAIDARGEPLEVTGTVKTVSAGEYVIKGPMYTGVRVSMGRTVVLDTGTVEIVVVEQHHEPWDIGCLQSLGIDPAAKRYVALKSRVHWRAGFKPILRHVVECCGVGVCTSDYSQLTFENVRRPIFPLDKMNEMAPGG